MTTTIWQDDLRALGACREAVEWAAGYATFAEAWTACERGDWLLWYLVRVDRSEPMSPARRSLVRIACACARLALRHVRAGEDRPRVAIELAERWANGDDAVTRQQLQAVAYDAAAATVDVSYAAYTATAYTAAAATTAAYAAATTTVDADDAAHAAPYAIASYAAHAAAYAAADDATASAYAAAYADARSTVLKQCADLVRLEYPVPPAALGTVG